MLHQRIRRRRACPPVASTVPLGSDLRAGRSIPERGESRCRRKGRIPRNRPDVSQRGGPCPQRQVGASASPQRCPRWRSHDAAQTPQQRGNLRPPHEGGALWASPGSTTETKVPGPTRSRSRWRSSTIGPGRDVRESRRRLRRGRSLDLPQERWPRRPGRGASQTEGDRPSPRCPLRGSQTPPKRSARTPPPRRIRPQPPPPAR